MILFAIAFSSLGVAVVLVHAPLLVSIGLAAFVVVVAGEHG